MIQRVIQWLVSRLAWQPQARRFSRRHRGRCWLCQAMRYYRLDAHDPHGNEGR